MTYESILHDLEQIYMYFLAYISKFLNAIKSSPLIMAFVFVFVSLPVIYFIISFIQSLLTSSDDVLNQSFKIFKAFNKGNISGKEKQTRKDFHNHKYNFNSRKENVTREQLYAAYNYFNFNSARSSSKSYQGKSANIDVEYDDEDN